MPFEKNERMISTSGDMYLNVLLYILLNSYLLFRLKLWYKQAVKMVHHVKQPSDKPITLLSLFRMVITLNVVQRAFRSYSKKNKILLLQINPRVSSWKPS